MRYNIFRIANLPPNLSTEIAAFISHLDQSISKNYAKIPTQVEGQRCIISPDAVVLCDFDLFPYYFDFLRGQCVVSILLRLVGKRRIVTDSYHLRAQRS